MTLSSRAHHFSRAARRGNPNYLCIIERALQPGSNEYLSIKAFLPSEFSFGGAAMFATPFAQAISERAPAPLAAALSAAGIQLVTQSLTAQVWQGSSPIEMSLELHFHVENDPIADLIDPIISLQRLVAPSVSPNGGFLRSPGPHLDYEQMKKLIGEGASFAADVATQAAADAKDLVGSAASSAVNGLKSTVTDAASAAAAAVKNAIAHPIDTAKKLMSPGEEAKGSPPASLGETVGNVAKSALTSGLKTVEAGAAKVDQVSGTIDRSLLSAVTNNITITLGNFLRFSSVVIQSVTPSFKTLPLENGAMSYASVTIAFSTFLTLTERDVVQMYLSKTAKKSNNAAASAKGASPTAPTSVLSNITSTAAAAANVVSTAKSAVSSVKSTLSNFG